MLNFPHPQAELLEALAQIRPADPKAKAAALRHWDAVAKPLHGLGLLEDVVARMAAIAPLRRDNKKAVAVFCADNGVVAQGVTQTDSSITAVVAGNMLRHSTSVCCMARAADADVYPLDAGMVTEVEGLPSIKVRRGTRDLSKEPAMTRDEAATLLLSGMEVARRLADMGYTLLAAGEMGIGNTTTSSAVASALLGKPAAFMTGRGAGLSDSGLQRKIQVIDDAIRELRPDPADPLDVLAKVGGYDIAGMAGFYLGCAQARVPVILDGFIANVAALVAVRLCPAALDAMLPSHLSEEPGAAAVMDALGLKPLMRLGMGLGEGTGAVTAMPLIDMALRVYFDMPSFDGMGIDAYVPQS